MVSVVLARQNSSSTHQATDNVGHDSSVQICHIHHIELVWIADQLHATVVDDHVVVLNLGVFLRNATTDLKLEKCGICIEFHFFLNRQNYTNSQNNSIRSFCFWFFKLTLYQILNWISQDKRTIKFWSYTLDPTSLTLTYDIKLGQTTFSKTLLYL